MFFENKFDNPLFIAILLFIMFLSDNYLENIKFYSSQDLDSDMHAFINSNVKIKIPSDQIYVEKISRYFLNFLNINYFEKHESVRIAFEESLINAIDHGNNNDSDKTVLVDIDINKDTLKIIIENEGDGFDYTLAMMKLTESQDNIFQGYGRGIFLISLYTDSFYFENDGKRIVLIKNRESEK